MTCISCKTLWQIYIDIRQPQKKETSENEPRLQIPWRQFLQCWSPIPIQKRKTLPSIFISILLQLLEQLNKKCYVNPQCRVCQIQVQRPTITVQIEAQTHLKQRVVSLAKIVILIRDSIFRKTINVQQEKCWSNNRVMRNTCINKILLQWLPIQKSSITEK